VAREVADQEEASYGRIAEEEKIREKVDKGLLCWRCPFQELV